jgi:hypothetical protein
MVEKSSHKVPRRTASTKLSGRSGQLSSAPFAKRQVASVLAALRKQKRDNDVLRRQMEQQLAQMASMAITPSPRTDATPPDVADAVAMEVDADAPADAAPVEMERNRSLAAPPPLSSPSPVRMPAPTDDNTPLNPEPRPGDQGSKPSLPPVASGADAPTSKLPIKAWQPPKIPLRAPPVFQGDGKMDIKEWFQIIGEMFKLSQIPEENTVTIATMYLGQAPGMQWRNAAKAYFDEKKIVPTWEVFASTMVDLYGVANMDRKARDALARLKQTDTCEKYTHLFLKLEGQLDTKPTEQDRVYRYVTGLSPELREKVEIAVEMNKLTTFAEIKALAMGIDLTLANLRREKGKSKATPPPNKGRFPFFP